jgi:hypothetical protein
MREALGRREFLKATAAALAASASVASAAGPKDKKIELPDAIPARVFGKTGMKLPILGFGGAALPKEWGNPLSREDRVRLVRYAYDQGVRFFDTAVPPKNSVGGNEKGGEGERRATSVADGGQAWRGMACADQCAQYRAKLEPVVPASIAALPRTRGARSGVDAVLADGQLALQREDPGGQHGLGLQHRLAEAAEIAQHLPGA